LIGLTPGQTGKHWGGIEMRASSLEDASEIGNEENKEVERRCEALLELGVRLVVCHGGVSPQAVQLLTSRGAMVVPHASFDGCELISRATRCAPIANITAVRREALGRAGRVRRVRHGGKCLLEVSGLGGAPASTILLHAPTASMMDEAERSVHDALCAAITTCHHKKVVPGGGAIQLELSARLRVASMEGSDGANQIGFSLLSDALEVLPLTIAANGGLDSIDMVARGRQAHHGGGEEGRFMGVDLDRQCVRNMLEETPMVIEPARLTTCMVSSAVALVAQVLRIDENIMLAPRANFVVPDM